MLKKKRKKPNKKKKLGKEYLERMKNKILKNIEWGILICCVFLLIIGGIALFSATQDTNYFELKRQVMWVIVSIPIMIVVVLINYETIAKMSFVFYGLFVILLIGVLFTESINGASSWYTITESIKFQPSEFAKIFVVIFFSYIMTKIQQRDSREINRPTRILLLLAIVAVPVLLIIKQPDYGTAIAFLISVVLMLFVAGIDKRYIIVSLLLVAVAMPLVYQFVLPDHAKTRIDVFLNPNLDPRGSRI